MSEIDLSDVPENERTDKPDEDHEIEVEETDNEFDTQDAPYNEPPKEIPSE